MAGAQWLVDKVFQPQCDRLGKLFMMSYNKVFKTQHDGLG